MDSSYMNDKLINFLLTLKRKQYQLSSKENNELRRLEKFGFKTEIAMNFFSEKLMKKSYIKYIELKKGTYDEGPSYKFEITDAGLRAIKYNHLPSESKKEIRASRFNMLQRIAIIISIPASIIAILLSIRSCVKESEIDSLEKRIELIETNIIMK